VTRDDLTAAIRQAYGPFGGSGYHHGGGDSECEYCGRPVQAVRNFINAVVAEKPSEAHRRDSGLRSPGTHAKDT
jgi:hypothetical protein